MIAEFVAAGAEAFHLCGEVGDASSGYAAARRPWPISQRAVSAIDSLAGRSVMPISRVVGEASNGIPRNAVQGPS